MKKLFLSILILVIISCQPLWAENSCVDCHSSNKDPKLEKTFLSWKESKHAKLSSACQACHKGDKKAKSKEKAHVWKDIKTSLKEKDIPQTCGRCHIKIYKSFQESSHYKKVEGDKRAPNCVTCHSPKSGYIIPPEKLETLCMTCHNHFDNTKKMVILKAKELYTFYSNSVRPQVDRSFKLLHLAQQQGNDVTLSEKLLTLSQQYHKKSKVSWHHFALDDFETNINKAFYLSIETEKLLSGTK
ncbi:MAG: hypothetical protein HQK84_05045 [Nitrospinae bacterium]|nr:hypothetical protein [Nitrospinota bacterium]